MERCILCDSNEVEIIDLRETTREDGFLFECNNCGRYIISRELYSCLEAMNNNTAPNYSTPTQRALDYIESHKKQLSKAAANWDYDANNDECMVLTSSEKNIMKILNKAKTKK